MKLRFRAYLGLLIGLIFGCSHAPNIAPGQIERAVLIGDFEPVGRTDAPDFRLEANGRYSEIDFLVQADRVGQTVIQSIDGMGPVDRGTWEYSKRTLILIDKNSHKVRRYSVAAIEGSIELTYRGDKSVKYKKRGQSPATNSGKK